MRLLYYYVVVFQLFLFQDIFRPTKNINYIFLFFIIILLVIDVYINSGIILWYLDEVSST